MDFLSEVDTYEYKDVTGHRSIRVLSRSPVPKIEREPLKTLIPAEVPLTDEGFSNLEKPLDGLNLWAYRLGGLRLFESKK